MTYYPHSGYDHGSIIPFKCWLWDPLFLELVKLGISNLTHIYCGKYCHYCLFCNVN